MPGILPLTAYLPWVIPQAIESPARCCEPSVALENSLGQGSRDTWGLALEYCQHARCLPQLVPCSAQTGHLVHRVYSVTESPRQLLVKFPKKRL